MGETIRQQPPEELARFYTLLDIATTNTDGTAWFDVSVDGATTIWRLMHTEEAPQDKLTPFRLHYSRYDLDSPDDPETLQIPKRSTLYLDPVVRGMNPRALTVPRLCAVFAERACDADTLGACMESFAAWSQSNHAPKIGDTNSVVLRLINTALHLPQNPLLDRSSRAMQALATITPPSANYEPVCSNLARLHHALLLSIEPGVKGLLQAKVVALTADRKAEVLEMAKIFDDMDLMDQRFWLNTGVHAGGVFTVPGMLELTHDRLQTERTMTALRLQEVSSVESAVRLYVDRLLSHYMTDTDRDTTKLSNVRAAISNDRGGVGLGKLIFTAQRTTESINEIRAERGRPPLSALSHTNLGHLGRAFIRIMRTIELDDLPAEVKLQQRRDDAMHANIIELLRTFLRDPSSALTPSDLRLRYPEATAEDIREMMEVLGQGGTHARAGTYLRKKQRGRGGVKVHGLQKPGHGLMS